MSTEAQMAKDVALARVQKAETGQQGGREDGVQVTSDRARRPLAPHKCGRRWKTTQKARTEEGEKACFVYVLYFCCVPCYHKIYGLD